MPTCQLCLAAPPRFAATYGHIEAMARSFKEGVDSVEGVEGVLLRAPETLPESGKTIRKSLGDRAALFAPGAPLATPRAGCCVAPAPQCSPRCTHLP